VRLHGGGCASSGDSPTAASSLEFLSSGYVGWLRRPDWNPWCRAPLLLFLPLASPAAASGAMAFVGDLVGI
jgi:hypothetical protein